MILRVTVPTSLGAPDDPDVLAVVEATISTKASAWTTPVYVDTEGDQYVYQTDAVPQTHAVTTANVASALLPPRVV